jgi:Putative auto-transporter adhesin, head GIN domain
MPLIAKRRHSHQNFNTLRLIDIPHRKFAMHKLLSQLPIQLLTPALLLTLTPLCFAIEQTRTLPEFKTIASTGVFNLTINIGQAQSITLTGDEKSLSRVKIEVRGDELVLSNGKSRNYNSDDSVDVTINMPTLTKLSLTGVGETKIKRINTDKFVLNYEGVGAVAAQGNVKNLTITAKGIGEINAQQLKARSAEVSLNGLGAVSVHASESLNANVNGIGSLTYYGKPPQLKTSATGLGHITSGD